MPARHLYPDPSDPHPVFMFGQIDLDAADPGSPLAFGEALLRAQATDGRDVAPATSPRRANRSVTSRSRAPRQH